jgi:hypothetical protein
MSKIVPYRPPTQGTASGYTPRHTLRGRYLNDTRANLAHVDNRFHSSPLARPEARLALARQVAATVAAGALSSIVIETIDGVLALEADTFAVSPQQFQSIAPLEAAFHLRRTAETLDRYLDAAGDFAVLASHLADALSAVVSGAPASALTAHKAAMTVPLVNLLPNAPRLLSDLIRRFWHRDLLARGHAHGLREILHRNVCLASGLDPDVEHPPHRLKFPNAIKEPPEELVDLYFRDTPLHRLLMTPVPLIIPMAVRFEHTHIVAGSGHGKTQTLQHMILNDLSLPDPPSLVIVDSHGTMLDAIARLAVFDPVHGRLRDRLVIIDPRDVTHPPALNLFAVSRTRHQGYDAATNEQLTNGVIELFDYIFGALLGADLTQKQGVVFRFLARLMLVIPGATIQTLREVLENPDPFLPYMQQLSGAARGFFEHQFFARDFNATKTQILRRLWGVLEQPVFVRLLSSPDNKLDLYDLMHSGKIVLVNTAKDFMKSERSAILGRMFIAMTLQAALERAALPPARRRPAFLIIDEAADYFDTSIDHLLVQARKYNVGICLAHQDMDQLNGGLRASIAGNTSTKIAGGVAWSDARSLAPDLRTSPEFILDQAKTAASTRFALFVRNLTPHAVAMSVPFGTLEAMPRMSEASFATLIAENRRRVAQSHRPTVPQPEPSRPAPTLRPPSPARPPTPQSTDDDPTDWRS